MKRIMLVVLWMTLLLLTACGQGDPVEPGPEPDTANAEAGRVQLEQKEALELEQQSRATDLDRREADLAQREQALAEQEKEVAARESDASRREEQVSAKEQELRGREDTLAEREAKQPSIFENPVTSAGEYGSAEWSTWIYNLEQSDNFSGCYWADGDDEVFQVLVLDIEAFNKSPLAEEMKQLNVKINVLQKGTHSYKKLRAAQEKLMEAFDWFEMSSMYVDVEQNALFVSALNLTDQRKQAIRDYCGIQEILFQETSTRFNPGT